MKRLLAVVLLIFISAMIFPYGATLKSVIQVKGIYITPPTINEESEIKFAFIVGKDLTSGGKIYIKFPQGFYVPATISKSYVDLGGEQPAEVNVDGNVVEITTTQKIQKNQGAPDGYPLTFSSSAGIKNPSFPDTYTFELWTSEESEHSLFDIFIGLTGSGNPVTGLNVSLDDSHMAGEATRYTIIFVVSQSGALVYSQDDYVDIYFPNGTILPDNFDPSNVIFKMKNCERVEKLGRRIRVYVPNMWFVGPLSQCNIMFLKDFGIRNPEFTGKYAIQVSTSKDTGLATSNLYDIYGSPVQVIESSLNPSSQLEFSEIRVKFKQSAQAGIVKDKSKVNIKFPAEFTLPSNLKPGAITINGTPCVKVELNNNILSIYSPINIDKNTDVELLIKKEFGIVNPEKTGTYQLFINTSSDAQLMPFNLLVTPSTVSNVSVTVSNTSAGQVSKYLITFKTGSNGKLLPGVDRVNIVFPIGTTIPTVISNSSVLINGIPTTLIEISGTTVTITPPLEISALSDVAVVFAEGAGIRNPVISNNYVIYVHTSKENTSVASSPYSIKNVPTTSLRIEPSQPDGLNDFYRTPPSLTLSASSATDPNPTTYYFFDGNSPVIYNGNPIRAPEGIHTLFYYSVDNEGHKEETKSIQFKVDTIPPVISVITPINDAILNSSTVLVKGNVDPGSVLKINGEQVQVDGLGNFETTIKLQNNPDVINLFGTDIAGNSSQVVIKVSFDVTPPALNIISPLMFQQINRIPVVVEGKTEAGAKITINGNTASVNEDGSFTYLLSSLSEGLNNIEIIATDAAGNSTKRNVSVKYSKSVTIILQVGNAFALVNGNTYTLEAAPTVSSGRTMVPLRFIGEAFGADFTYEPTKKIIDITFGSDKIRMQIGKKSATVNGKEVVLDVAPFIVNGRTLVPIRFISETFGAEVAWDATTKTVTIIYPKQ